MGLVSAKVSFAAPDIYEMKDAGIRISVQNPQVEISLQKTGKFRVKVGVDPGNYTEPIALQVELTATGRNTWPAEELYVIGEIGQMLPIRRNGVQWHKFEMTVPGVWASYTICADKNRDLPIQEDPIAGKLYTNYRASICKWYGGLDAALCIRFDDSHPTHLSRAIPVLDEFGFRATFMINPGGSNFKEHQEEWEACARTDKHEFANHTLHHNGANSEKEIEQEVGQVSEYIWTLFPQRSRLLAFNRGGSTTWVTKKPFGHYLRKYDLFPVMGSLGMDDVYGNRIDALERHLARHIQSKGWCRIHFHSIGQKLASSEENFIAAMKLAKTYEKQLWITGLADAYKYKMERDTAKLIMVDATSEYAKVQLLIGTAPVLYDHPLTVQVELPSEWSSANISIANEDGELMPVADFIPGVGKNIVRWDVPPVNCHYLLRRN